MGVNKKPRNIAAAHFGNGLTVYDRNNEKYGDFEHLAHIDYNRNVTYYKIKLTDQDRQTIETIAATDTRSISTTQDQPVLKPL